MRRRPVAWGLICGAIVGAALLYTYVWMPVVNSAKMSARIDQSKKNLKAIGNALDMYAQANSGLLPPADRWADSARISHDVLRLSGDSAYSYAFNPDVGGKWLWDLDDQTIIVCQCPSQSADELIRAESIDGGSGRYYETLVGGLQVKGLKPEEVQRLLRRKVEQ